MTATLTETAPPTSDASTPTPRTSAGHQTDQRDHGRSGTQRSLVALVTDSEGGGGDATIRRPWTKPFASLADPALGLAAEILDDLERTKIANENRLRQLTGTSVDADGIQRQRMYDPGQKDVLRLTALVDLLGDAEHKADLHLRNVMRRHPLWQWAKPIPGVGERQFARLLAVIGDPYMREMVEEDGSISATPRTVSALWAYCGYRVDDGRAVRRARGQQANWSTVAKSRAYLIAEACMKAHSRYPNPYGQAYYDRKAATEGRLHSQPCAQCGGAGKADAAIGQPWRDGHRHADALRVAAKALLRDMWREAKRLHSGDGLPDA